MSYESALNDLWEQRQADKAMRENRRLKFRQSVLDRQNKQNQNVSAKRTSTTEENNNVYFVMPDVLPTDEAQLKWLIFQNIDLIQKSPERKKEAQANIKRIKEFINEQKTRQ